MPTNIYGANDNFDISSSHVIPGLITKFLNAKKNNTNVVVWGSGKAIREFLHVDDLARAIFKVLLASKSKLDKVSRNKLPIFNVGSKESVSIKNLVKLLKKITKFKGKIIFDKKYPDGTLNKNLDSSKIRKINWHPKIKLYQGLNKIIKLRKKNFFNEK